MAGAAPGAADEVAAQLSVGDWAVLGLLAEGESHGFALARQLSATGELGRIWTVGQAVVYRTIDLLVAKGMAEVCGAEPGLRGPSRTVVRATAAGQQALARWLALPVEHFRDTRTVLLLKLELLRRGGRDQRSLLLAQRKRLVSLVATLERRITASARGSEFILVWRSEAIRGGIRAIDRMLETLEAGASRGAPELPRRRIR
jgi:PadR family transcriptional regulator AphA